MLKVTKVISLILCVVSLSFSGIAQSQSVDDIRWKSPSKVEAILGTPLSKVGPAGTVRTYQMWDYGTYVVAFTNNKVSHVFAWPPKNYQQ